MLAKCFQANMLNKKEPASSLSDCFINYIFQSTGTCHERGGDEADGNLKQLLQMKAEGYPSLAEWLKRKENVYTSPDNYTE